jgi:hypothetical protein
MIGIATLHTARASVQSMSASRRNPDRNLARRPPRIRSMVLAGPGRLAPPGAAAISTPIISSP